MMYRQMDYDLPYRTSVVESLFALSTRVVANQISSNLLWTRALPPNVKSVLVELLGRRNLLTEPVFRCLAHRDLTSVVLSGHNARDSTTRILCYLTKLKSLHIPGHEISSSSLVGLFPQLPFLEQVDLSSSDEVDDQVLHSLAKSCPMLHQINLGKCTKFTHKGILHLANDLYSLHILDLSYTKLTDEGMKALSEGPCCGTLQELHIDGCKLLTARSGQYLQLLSRISTLSFYDCPQLLKSEWFESFGNQQKKPFKNLSFTVE